MTVMLAVVLNAGALFLILGLTFGVIIWKVFASKPSPKARAIIASIITPLLLVGFFLYIAWLTLH